MPCVATLLLLALADGTAPSPAARAAPRKVAIVVHEGVELLDFAGPAEVFSAAAHEGAVNGVPAFELFTVAPAAGPIVSQRFLDITPDFTLADCPAPDFIVIPGGATGVLLKDEAFMRWIGAVTGRAEVVLSVCTGALVLARTGLLDGNEATTHWSALDALRRAAPKATVVADRRFVDSGVVVTSAGVSAGIDGALHVVARLLGRRVAEATAHYMEYRWQPEAADLVHYSVVDALKACTGEEPPRASLVALQGLLADPLLAQAQRCAANVERARDLLSENPWCEPVTIAPAGEPGTPLTISGVVRSADGKPLSGARLHVFHADAAGLYTQEKAPGTGPTQDEPRARLQAFLETGPDGRYEFRTVRPGAAPQARQDATGDAAWIPQKIHFVVTAPGKAEKQFQLLFADDPRLTAWWQQWAKEGDHPVSQLAHDARDPDAALRGSCDITMQ